MLLTRPARTVAVHCNDPEAHNVIAALSAMHWVAGAGGGCAGVVLFKPFAARINTVIRISINCEFRRKEIITCTASVSHC